MSKTLSSVTICLGITVWATYPNLHFGIYVGSNQDALTVPQK